MTLTQLEYIVAVDKTRNFTEAAKLCGVTQPSLSMQVQKLEDSLGVVIFDRSQGPVIPTDIGKKVLSQARVVLAESRRMPEIIRDEREEISGAFRLGIIPTMAPYLVPLFVESFAKHYPQVQLELYEDQTATLFRRLENEDLDAAILSPTETMSPKLQTRTLFYEPFMIYASTKHELAAQSKIEAAHLPKQGLWLLEDGHCLRDQVLQVCHLKDRKNLFTPNVTFQSGSLATLTHLIDKHQGYTLLPMLASLSMRADEKKNHVRYFKHPVPVRQVSVVFSRVHLKRKLIEILSQEIDRVVPKEYARTPTRGQQVKIPH